MKKSRAGFLAVLASLTTPALALDFVSTSRPAILYDAPSLAAEKIAVVSANYPLERIVATEGWIKVRDDAGSLLWIEESALGKRRTARINVPVAQILEEPIDSAPARFRAVQGVSLEILSVDDGGWVRVRLPDGLEGYLRSRDAWGL
jgi:SH3-like domain-containing protein